MKAELSSLNWPYELGAMFAHFAKRRNANIHAGSRHNWTIDVATRLPDDPLDLPDY